MHVSSRHADLGKRSKIKSKSAQVTKLSEGDNSSMKIGAQAISKSKAGKVRANWDGWWRRQNSQCRRRTQRKEQSGRIVD